MWSHAHSFIRPPWCRLISYNTQWLHQRDIESSSWLPLLFDNQFERHSLFTEPIKNRLSSRSGLSQNFLRGKRSVEIETTSSLSSTIASNDHITSDSYLVWSSEVIV